MVRISVRMPDELIAELQAEAHRRSVSVAAVVRERLERAKLRQPASTGPRSIGQRKRQRRERSR
jgi:hypothetical protein